MKSKSTKKLDPVFLGKIQFSRFLDLPLTRFKTFVKLLDTSSAVLPLSSLIEKGILKGTKVFSHPKEDPTIIGEIQSNGLLPTFLYCCEFFVREYRFDDKEVEEFLSDGTGNESLRKTLRRFRLVNSRNRMTHAVIEFLISYQFPFIRTVDPLLLKPLTLDQTEKYLSNVFEKKIFDKGRLSRILRHTLVLYPDGKIGPLSNLCPSWRAISCHFVESVIKDEKKLIIEGKIDSPLSDSKIASRVFALFGTRVSRRTVTYIRRNLGIPGCREREKERTYLEATEDFSSPLILSVENIKTFVPSAPGVYEIRSCFPGMPEKVIYIGSAGNLRKRLIYHIYARGTNPRLWKKISLGSRFRYRIIKEDRRTKERELYRAFRSTFGESPDCNKISP